MNHRQRQGVIRYLRLGGAALWIIGIGIYVHFNVAKLGFFSDEHALLQYLGEMLAGRTSFMEYLAHPHNIHYIIIERFIIWSTHFLGDHAALAIRVVLISLHTVSAILLARLCYKHTGSLIASTIAGGFFAGSIAFSGSASWFAANFTPLNTFFLLGLNALYSLDTKPKTALTIASLSTLLAMINGQMGVVLSLSLCAYALIAANRSPYRWAACASIVAICAISLLLYTSASAPSVKEVTADGVLHGLWTLLVFPYRLVASNIHIGWPPRLGWFGTNITIVASLISWLLIILALSVIRRDQRKLVLTTSLSGLALALLAGYQRSDRSYEWIYFTGRYFYLLCVPSALLVGALVYTALEQTRTRLWSGTVAIAAVLALSIGAVRSSRANVDSQFDTQYRHLQVKVIEQIRQLGDAFLDRRLGTSKDRALPDGNIVLDNFRLDYLRLSSMLHALHPGVQWWFTDRTTEQISYEVNQTLDQWYEDIGQKLVSACVVNGHLADVRFSPYVDFSLGSGSQSIKSGFYPLGKPVGYRWMSGRGQVLLRRSSDHLTISSLVLDIPPHKTLEVTIKVDGMRVGTIRYNDALQSVRTFEVPRRPSTGQIATIELESNQTWKPSRYIKDSVDSRDISVGIRKIYFGEQQKYPSKCLDFMANASNSSTGPSP
jgi:hypothetical protein